MKPVQNAYCNMTLTAPAQWDEDEYGVCQPLPARADSGMIMTWWSVPWRDRLRLLFGAKVRIVILASRMPPIEVIVDSTREARS